jgi:hypothetical protein
LKDRAVTTKEQRDVAIAREKMREAFFDGYNTLNVTDIVDRIMDAIYAVAAAELAPKRKTRKKKR